MKLFKVALFTGCWTPCFKDSPRSLQKRCCMVKRCLVGCLLMLKAWFLLKTSMVWSCLKGAYSGLLLEPYFISFLLWNMKVYMDLDKKNTVDVISLCLKWAVCVCLAKGHSQTLPKWDVDVILCVCAWVQAWMSESVMTMLWMWYTYLKLFIDTG